MALPFCQINHGNQPKSTNLLNFTPDGSVQLRNPMPTNSGNISFGQSASLCSEELPESSVGILARTGFPENTAKTPAFFSGSEDEAVVFDNGYTYRSGGASSGVISDNNQQVVQHFGDRCFDAINESPDSFNTSSDAIDVKVHNIVAMFNTRCHVDLQGFALHGVNVEYERAKGLLVKQLRKPKCVVKIFSSGKVIIMCTKSEVDSKIAARRIARLLQKRFPRVKFSQYRVTNILAVCKLPWGIKITQMAKDYPADASYEPELSSGLIWRFKEPKATLRIHTTGTVTITGEMKRIEMEKTISEILPYEAALFFPVLLLIFESALLVNLATTVEAVEQSLGQIFPIVLPYKTLLPRPASESVAKKRKHASSDDDAGDDDELKCDNLSRLRSNDGLNFNVKTESPSCHMLSSQQSWMLHQHHSSALSSSETTNLRSSASVGSIRAHKRETIAHVKSALSDHFY